MTSSPADTRYASGVQCTWHGPLAEAAPISKLRNTSQGVDSVSACPVCLGELREVNLETFQTEIRDGDRRLPGYEQMVTWSRGRCFPDFDTLQNAYRQAMEE